MRNGYQDQDITHPQFPPPSVNDADDGDRDAADDEGGEQSYNDVMCRKDENRTGDADTYGDPHYGRPNQSLWDRQREFKFKSFIAPTSSHLGPLLQRKLTRD